MRMVQWVFYERNLSEEDFGERFLDLAYREAAKTPPILC